MPYGLKANFCDHTVYVDDGALIAKNTSLIVARVPLSAHQKRTW
jgi:hypothetical protein